jgi:5-methylcytosine-specific restriction enzyme subunit McrC
MSYDLIEQYEHFNGNLDDGYRLSKKSYDFVYKYGKYGKPNPSFTIKKDGDNYNLKTGYFIGVDWVEEEKCALYIAPKLNKSDIETNYVKMLFDAMRHIEDEKHLTDLYKIKWDAAPIEITQQQDLLTPFLITEFLGILKQIVRKGLKKSYYKVERKLNSRIKGKINIGKTVKHHLTKQRTLETVCTFEEFGVDNLENRILKKALQFIKRYLPQYHNISESEYLQNTFNFISPAFHEVSTKVSVREIQSFKSNAFFKEYDRGLELAKMILKRFGYNISKTEEKKIQTPPFWIDMSQLFELYVLGMLKDRFGKAVTYHFKSDYTEIDYLLNTENCKMVIDAKYKLKYEKNQRHIEDVRQVSGYARLSDVYDEFYGKNNNNSTLIDCLIIHAVRHSNEEVGNDTLEGKDLQSRPIHNYKGIYKFGIYLPTIKTMTQS